MKRRKSFLYALIAATALFALSCSNGSSDSGSEPVSKNTYVAFSHLSPYMQSTLKETDGKITSSTKTVPEVYIVHGSRLSDLSEEQILLAVKTCLEGQTFIIDTPTYDQVVNFCEKLIAVLDKTENEYFNDMTEVSPYSIANLLDQFYDDLTNTGVDTWETKAFEAIAMRKDQVYFVHDINETVDADELDISMETEGSAKCPETESKEDGNEKNYTVLADPENGVEIDWGALKNSSIQAFADWINEAASEESKSQRTARSAIDDAKKAQSFVHNFTVTFNRSHEHYDGRYNGRSENVQLYVDVWTACSIDTNTDYYLVRTSAVCNNQQLKYSNDWSPDKYISPYMGSCEITSALGDGHAILKSSECSPKTTQGSQSFTSGTSFNFGGNAGFNTNGPTGGISTGFSISESRTQSIPDISIKVNPATDEKSVNWRFSTPDIIPYWDWFTTKCDGAKGIQTNAAIFDTYALYTMPSNYYWNQEKVPLKSTGKVTIYMLTGWLTNAGLNLHWQEFGNTRTSSFTDYVRKPCNSYCDYIMFCDTTNISPERKDLYHRIVKDYFPEWGSNVRYYGFCDTYNKNKDTWDFKRHNELAKYHFSSVEKTIRTNQNVLKARGFEGNVKFIIQNAQTGDKVDSFELTF
ncbi:hypothetical protein MSI_10550 [Treponema sp. JC4]|nr:hypothetical protein MSI_10550 [Treponema sp. JC4]